MSMKPRVTIRKAPMHDALTADIQLAGQYGAAQLRAVVPLRRLRRMAARRLGIPPHHAVAGDTSLAGCKCEKVTTQLAGLALMDIVRKAAAMPMQSIQSSQGRIQMLAKKLKKMDQLGQVEEMGGWEALHELLARRRQAKARAQMASGVPEPMAKMKEKQEAREQTAAMQLAMADSESADMEGWNPFSSAANLVEKGARGLTRAAHYAAVAPAELTLRAARGVGRGLYQNVKSEINRKRNLFRRGGGGGGSQQEEPQEEPQEEASPEGDGGEPMDASQPQR